MSTEHQQYSLENQAAAIAQYAATKGYEVIRTYEDAAKSGLLLKRRTGLRQLLQDVISGSAGYRAILVYDVSRWGRFQDMDESAYYEFMCRQAGIHVHYTAETFDNDGSFSSCIMKALKRSMAGEYSRELSAKVSAGQERMAKRGFKQGGIPGYGLRRMLISSDGIPKQILAHRERKSITTDRVVLVPGPPEEVVCVRLIYKLLIEQEMKVKAIARELGNRGIPYKDDAGWRYGNVFNILTHPKYKGCLVYGRTTQKLHTPCVPVPAYRWVTIPNAFPAIIDPETFDRAQQILANRPHNKPNEGILAGLRRLLAKHGKISKELIENDPSLPGYSNFRFRFGTVQRAYEMIGYKEAPRRKQIESRLRVTALKDKLIEELIRASGGRIKLIKGRAGQKDRLRLPNGRIVSILICLSNERAQGRRVWRVEPRAREHRYAVLLVLLNQSNDAVEQVFALRKPFANARYFLWPGDKYLRDATKMSNYSELIDTVDRLFPHNH